MRNTFAIAIAATALLSGALLGQPKTAIELEEVTGVIGAWNLGYRIRVPRASQTDNNEFGHWYRRRIDALFSWEVQVTLSSPPVDSLAAAVKAASVPGLLLTTEGRELQGGYMILKKPSAPDVAMAQVWVYKNGRKAQAFATCFGPARELETLVAMCGSLEVVG